MNLIDLLTKGLTKTGVASNDGTQFFNSPTDAAQAFAGKEGQALQPTTDQVTNVQIPTLDDSGNPVGGSGSVSEQAPDMSQMPAFLRPNFQQASTNSLGMRQNSPALTKKGSLINILLGGLQGGLNGLSGNAQTYAATGRNAGFGGGVSGAINIPMQQAGERLGLQRGQLENELTQAQIGLLPWQRAAAIANVYKTQAETGNQQAQAAKAGAEANSAQYENTLKQAQASAAKYKEVGGVLYDVSGTNPQPVQSAGQFVPADSDMAGVANVPVGTPLPLATAKSLKQMATDGITTAQAGGRSLLIDKTNGKVIKDLGASTPMAVINAQMAPPAQISPDMQKAIDLVGKGQTDLQTALSNYRRFPGQANAFLGALHDQYPDFFQGNYNTAKTVQTKAAESEVPTNIGNQKLAFNTAIAHAALLRQAAQALGNGDNQTLAGLKNKFANEFGASGPITAQTIAQAYTREVNKMLSGGHITDAEIGAVGKTLDPTKQNFQTINSVLNAYQNLAQSKLKNLNQQKQDALDLSRGKQPSSEAAPTPANPHADIGFVPLQ